MSGEALSVEGGGLTHRLRRPYPLFDRSVYAMPYMWTRCC